MTATTAHSTSLSGEPDSKAGFTPLVLDDRVTIMALFYEIVSEEQVERAWHMWQRLSSKERVPLWRVLVQQPDVDPETVRGVSAQLYGFEEEVLTSDQTTQLLRDLFGTFSVKQWEQMINLLVVPVSVGEDPRTGAARLVFATHDPVRPEVARLLQTLPLDGFECRYTPEADLLDVLHAALDQRWFEGATELTAQLAARDRRRKGQPPAPALPPRMDDEPDALHEAFVTRSMAAWFDSVLVALHQQQAQEAHILLDYRRTVEVHLVRGEHVRLWRKEERIHPEGLLGYLTDEVLEETTQTGTIVQAANIQRWIDDTLSRFYVRFIPSEEMNGGGKIVIQRAGQREALGERRGLGPWK